MPDFGSVHVSNKNTKGSKVGTFLVIVLVLGLGGGGYYFTSNEPELIRHLDEQDDFAVAAAYVCRFKGVPPGAVGPLRKGLEKGSPKLKKACAGALCTLKDSENSAFLGAAATEDADPTVRAAAMAALGQNGDVNVGRYMNQALEDESIHVLEEACLAVGELKLMRFVPQLIGHLNHYDGNVKRAAKKGLEKFTEEGESYGFDPVEWNKWYEGQYD